MSACNSYKRFVVSLADDPISQELSEECWQVMQEHAKKTRALHVTNDQFLLDRVYSRPAAAFPR